MVDTWDVTDGVDDCGSGSSGGIDGMGRGSGGGGGMGRKWHD